MSSVSLAIKPLSYSQKGSFIKTIYKLHSSSNEDNTWCTLFKLVYHYCSFQRPIAHDILIDQWGRLMVLQVPSTKQAVVSCSPSSPLARYLHPIILCVNQIAIKATTDLACLAWRTVEVLIDRHFQSDHTGHYNRILLVMMLRLNS